MKKIIRIASLLIAAVFVFSACQAAEPEIIPEYADDVDTTVNLGGFKLKWGFAKSGSKEENVFGYIPGTAFADLALERKKNIETNNNCTIEMTYSDFGTIGSAVQTSAMSGESIYDIATDESFVFVQYMRAGYLSGLSNLIDVTNTEKWGTPNMLQSLMWDNNLYGVVPYAWPDLLYTSFGYPIIVNENLISQYGHDDPREFVEANTWTWDKFEEVLHEYTHQEGDYTVYGMATHGAYFAMMMFLSNGVALSDYSNGEVVCGAYTDPGFAALERAQLIHRETCRDCFHPDENTSNVVTNFKNGNSVLLTTNAYEILGHSSSIMYVMDNVGILPYPLGPNATPGVYKGYHESMLYSTSIPVNAKDPETAAFILSEMYEPFDEYKTKDDIIEYMATQTFFDIRDARVYANMLENNEYGFFLEGARSLIEESVASNSTVATLREKYESKYQSILEDYIAHHYAARIAIYGE
jgi:ABC-type glycerol-3-phosphate transport system substrate-binding protein